MGRARISILAWSLFAAGVAHAGGSPPAPVTSDWARAHHKKVVGAVLMGVGSALALVGQILLIDAALHPVHPSVACPRVGPCSTEPYLNELEVVPASVLLGVGGSLLVSGIPVYAVGGAQMRRAERPRPTLSVAALGAAVRF